MIGVKYIGPVMDGSGYAKAARENIKALHKIGVPITISSVSFDSVKPDLGEDGRLMQSLMDKSIEYNTVLIHTTPEFWGRFVEPNKRNIGYTVWETSKLHQSWPGMINSSVDLCIVPCSWNKDVFKESGVTVPIEVVPHVVEVVDTDTIKAYDINGIDSNTFVFYSVNQFTERKNIISLIKAYWHAFRNKEDVALVLKTYRNNYNDSEKEVVREILRKLKVACPMNDGYPPVYLVLNILSEDEIAGLHKRGDCYVTTDRGEGFGLSSATAGAFGNPLIATGFGGVTEYAKPNNSFLIDYSEVIVSNMPWSPWYNGDQTWAHVDEKNAAQLMQYVYCNRKDAFDRGHRLQSYIGEHLSYAVIGSKLKNCIERG